MRILKVFIAVLSLLQLLSLSSSFTIKAIHPKSIANNCSSSSALPDRDQEKATQKTKHTSTTANSSTMTRSTFGQRLLKALTIQSLFIGGISSTSACILNPSSSAAFAFSAPKNENNNNNNDNLLGNQKKDLFSDGTTYGFEDGTTFSMTSTSSATANNDRKTKPQVAYRPLMLTNIPDFENVRVPVAMWFRPDADDDKDSETKNEEKKEGGMKERTASKLIMDYPTIATSIPATSSFSSSSTSSSSDAEPENSQSQHSTTYKHRISVRKIGKMLARLSLPEFLSKDFTLDPSSTKATVIDGTFAPLPKSTSSSNSYNKPVIILAHGFLGSRFDLSHIGEQLALDGFIVFSPEYPESLSNSYDSTKLVTSLDGENDTEIKLDRGTINDQLVKLIENDLNIQPTSFGIVGHSLGTGTAMNSDDSWTRVCIAGPPIRRKNGTMTQEDVKGNILSIVSVNDGAVTMSRVSSMIPDSFVRLDESRLFPNKVMDDEDNSQNKNLNDLPPKSILIIDRNDAPNHISFLAENVNDAMVSFLSPLLPVAQLLNIPVLDFDKYKESRDSVATSEVVIPLVSSFLKQYMILD